MNVKKTFANILKLTELESREIKKKIMTVIDDMQIEIEI